VNRDGTYDIRYDDGDTESGALKLNVRKHPDTIKIASPGRFGASDSSELNEGDKVEVLYKGKGTKWFSGKISRVNRDGTYDIVYDDGDRESGALKMNVRRHPSSVPPGGSGVGVGAGSASGVLREGMKVEARFKGKARYYPGVIRRENRDGTFDIDYDDVKINK
jgi:hypothetical protein